MKRCFSAVFRKARSCANSSPISISTTRHGTSSRLRCMCRAGTFRTASPMNKALVVSVLAGAALAAGIAVAAEYKIGVINTERILGEAEPAKEAARKIEQEFKARDAAIAKQEQDLRDLVSRTERDAAT